MILIADCGSTKCDWSLINNGKVDSEYYTQGFNPYFHSEEEIIAGIHVNTKLVDVSHQVKLIRYLGAGCSTKEMTERVKGALEKVFINAKVIVEHDLLGAAFATYQGEPAITGILGTGSNVCYFDGKNLHQKTPSLGFIMGDEGSGAYFGKKLVTAFCYGWLPKEVEDDFVNTYNLTASELIGKVNSQPHANVFLASLMPFVTKNKANPYINKMVVDGMDAYFKTHVLCFENAKEVKIHFVGSIAHFWDDAIYSVAHKYGLTIGQIIQKPGSMVVDYFLKYGIKS